MSLIDQFSKSTGLPETADMINRFNVRIARSGERAMMFAHGFGCDQNMWRYVAPSFEADYRTILFDHVGAGGSDLASYDSARMPLSAGTSTMW